MSSFKLYKQHSSTSLLVFGFIIIILLVIIFALIVIDENNKISSLSKKLYRHPFTVSNEVLKANIHIISMHRYMKDVVLAEDHEQLERAIQRVNQHEVEVFKHFNLIKQRFLGKIEMVNSAYNSFVIWKQIRNEVIEYQSIGQQKKAADITKGKGAVHVQLLTQKMDVLINFAQNKADEFQSHSVKTSEKSRKFIITLVFMILLVGMINSVFVVLRVRKAEKESNNSALKLKENETKFRGVFEQAAVGVARLAPDGSWLQVNKKLCDIVGYTHEELLTKTFQDITYPDDLQIDLGYVNQLLEDKIKTYSLEKRYFKKNGDIIWINLTGSLVRDTNNKPDFFVAIIEDISQRKQAELTLSESERHFRTIFEQAAVGVALINSNSGQFIRVNKRFSDIIGYSIGEISESKTFQEITHPDDLQLDLDNMKKLIAGKIHEFSMEKRYFHKDGSIVWGNLTVSPTWEVGEEPSIHIAVIEDITERKQAELEVKKSEEMFRAVFNQQLQFMAILSNDGHTLEINELPLKVQGTKAKDYIGKLLWESPAWCNLPEWHEILSQRLEKVRDMKEPLLTEDIYQDANGSIRYADASTLALRTPDGEVSGFLMQATDTTDRKLAIDQAKDIDIVLSSVFQLLNDLFFLLKEDGTIIDYRAKKKTSLYISPDKFLGKPMQDILPSEISSIFLNKLNKAKTGKLTHFEYIVPINDDEKFYEARLVKQPKVNRYIMVVRDISVHKNSEQELRKLAQAVEQSPESIIITNTDVKIEYVNEAFVKTSGYTLGEVIGHDPSMLQSGKTPPETYKDLWDKMGKGESWHGEFCNKRKDGSEYFESAIITPIFNKDRSISHYVAVKEDITKKKSLENELEQHHLHLEELVKERTIQLTEAREQAETANIAKSTFLANMSHEIRTPMNGVLGMTHLALQTKLSDKQRHYIDKAHQSAENLLGILNDILDFSKIEAGKLKIDNINFEIKQIIQNILDQRHY